MKTIFVTGIITLGVLGLFDMLGKYSNEYEIRKMYADACGRQGVECQIITVVGENAAE